MFMNIVAPEKSTYYSNSWFLSKAAVRNYISQNDLVSEWTFTTQS